MYGKAKWESSYTEFLSISGNVSGTGPVASIDAAYMHFLGGVWYVEPDRTTFTNTEVTFSGSTIDFSGCTSVTGLDGKVKVTAKFG